MPRKNPHGGSSFESFLEEEGILKETRKRAVKAVEAWQLTRTHAYKIRAKVWRYPGAAGWHFVTLPKTHAAAIKRFYVGRSNLGRAKGWGSLPVAVSLGRTTWHTSIFPDRQSGSYLLPLKAEIRKAAKIAAGDAISFRLEVRV